MASDSQVYREEFDIDDPFVVLLGKATRRIHVRTPTKSIPSVKAIASASVGHKILLTLRDAIEIGLWLVIIFEFITRGH